MTNPTLPALIDVLFRDAVNATLGTSIPNLAPSNLPRLDLVTAFLTGFKGVNQQSTVTASEMVRLNTGIAATPAATQSTFGVAGGDLAGFPNGRRPGDDVVDLALRVVMGRLCHPLTIGGDSVDLGLCKPADAPIGLAPLTDGAPVTAANFDPRSRTCGRRSRVPAADGGRRIHARQRQRPPACDGRGHRRDRRRFLLHWDSRRRGLRYRPTDGSETLLLLPAALGSKTATSFEAGNADSVARRTEEYIELRAAQAMRVTSAGPRRSSRRGSTGRSPVPTPPSSGRPGAAAP